METGKMILWLAQTLLALLLLFSVQIPLRKKRKPVLRTVLFLIKALLIPVSALLFVAIESAFAYRHGDLLVAIYTALAADVGASILEFAVRQFRNAGNRQSGYSNCLLKLHAVLNLLLCACILFYGTFNALHVGKKTHTWQADGLTQAHTFAFAADLHMGSTQSMNVLADLCRQINQASPEFVILGGDVTDELSSLDDMQKTYQILSQIDAPVYYIYGNHDRQPKCDYLWGRTYSDQELNAAIRNAGIHILSDEYVQIADDLVLLGREDLTMGDGRKVWSDLAASYQGTGALIVADHQPYDNDQLAAEVSALQLSGHTHAGQLWPLQIVYRLLGLQAYGEFEEPGTTLYVSAGVSDWMIPLRTEEHCEWDLITLIPSAASSQQ